MSKKYIVFILGLWVAGSAMAQPPRAEEHAHGLGRDSLDQVVITGTMNPVKRSASPVAVELYSREFFLKNPSPVLFDALQMVNGVRPQVNCNICNTGDIHINGLEGPYTMVLIDGMPIVSSLGSVYGLSGIPNALIERVEVVKGPASSLYGSEAIGGLVNVITKDPESAPTISIDVMASSWQELNSDLGLTYKSGAMSGLLGLNYYNYTHAIDKNEDGFTDVTLQNRASVFNKMSFKRKDQRQASVALRYVNEDRWGGEMNWNKKFRGGDSIYGESIYTSRLELIGNYQLPTPENIIFSFSGNIHEQRSAYGHKIFNAKQQIAFGQLAWRKKIASRHDLLAAAVVRLTVYDDNTVATTLPEQVLLPGFLVQDDIRLTPKQQLLFGARYDYDKRHGNIYTPRVAYKFSITPHDIVRINCGTGFRVVNLFTEDHAALTGAREVVIVGELRPEKSYNANINYTRKVYFPNASLNIDLSGWYTYFTNRIVPDYFTNPNQIIYRNLDGFSISRGVSANLEYGLGKNLRITGGTSLLNVSVTQNDASGHRATGRQLLTEKWSGTWSVSYSFGGSGLSMDYTGNVYGPMLLPVLSSRDPRSNSSPAYSIQNVQVSWKVLGVVCYTGIKNLLNFTPAKHAPFLIARANDPFDKRVEYTGNGQVLATAENPYALTFDTDYVYASSQGLRGFAGVRFSIK